MSDDLSLGLYNPLTIPLASDIVYTPYSISLHLGPFHLLGPGSFPIAAACRVTCILLTFTPSLHLTNLIAYSPVQPEVNNSVMLHKLTN